MSLSPRLIIGAAAATSLVFGSLITKPVSADVSKPRAFTSKLDPFKPTAHEALTEKAYKSGDRLGPSWFKTGDFGDNVTILSSPAIVSLLTKLRDKRTSVKEYVLNGDRLMRILAEEGIARVPSVKEQIVDTPCGPYRGLSLPNVDNLCAVSIVRSGDILLEAVIKSCPGVCVGKILIQRDEHHPDKIPKLFYSKLPQDVADRDILLVDPMIGTAGSAKCAIKVISRSLSMICILL